MSSQPIITQALPSASEYILSLFAPADLICVMTLQSGKPQHQFIQANEAASDEFIASLRKQNEAGCDIYVCMNPLTAKRRIKANVSRIRTLYIDIDYDGIAALEKISQSTLVPKPHFILQSSPNKFYAIWGVADIQPADQERLLDALIQEFGGDPAASDCTRVLRLPGFMNHKYPEKPVVTIIGSTFDGGEYTAADFHVKVAPFKLAEKTPTVINEGDRHTRLVSLAGKLRREGFNEQEILASLQLANKRCTRSLPDAEVAGIAESITAQYAPATTIMAKSEPRSEVAAINEKSSHNKTASSSTTEPVVVSGMVRTASSIKPHRLKWLWEKRIPLSKIALFAGNPDNGKSLAANSIAATLTTGRPFPDFPNMIPPSDVLMMLGEDDLEDTAIPRLMAAGANLDKIHFLEGVMRGNKEGDVRLDVDMGVLESKFQEFPNARLLVIDPISNFLGDTNMFGEQDVRAKVLVPLKQLAVKYKVAVIIVMHLNKKQDLDAISRVGGAMAFIGIARCSWLFVRDEASEDGTLSENFTMSRMKNNLTAASLGGLAYQIKFDEHVFDDEAGPVGAPYVAWGGVVQKSADQALGKGSREVGRPKGSDSKLKDAVGFLEDALADGRRIGKELFEEARQAHGIARRTLDRARGDLHIHPYKEGTAWYWELSPMNATTETVMAAAENLEPAATPMDVQ